MSFPEAASQSLAVSSALAVRIRAAVGTKHRFEDLILMVKGGDVFARGRIPELGGFVRTGRQDPHTVRTKRGVVDCILMLKGGDLFARGAHPRAWRSRPHWPSGSASPSGLNAAPRTAS